MSWRIVVQVTPERLTIAAAFPFVASNACTELAWDRTTVNANQAMADLHATLLAQSTNGAQIAAIAVRV